MGSSRLCSQTGDARGIRGAQVLCVGNELAHDDGVGIVIGRLLRELELGPGVEMRFLQDIGFDLVDSLRQADQVVIVDAAQTGRRPGTCFTLAPTDLESQLGRQVSCHGIGVPELLGLARRLDPRGATAEVTVVCVEAEDVRPYGLGLSAAVRQALPEALTLVLRVVGVAETVVGRARRLAQQAAVRPGRLDDACAG